ncbi:MAG: chemotaxis response regulator protein-glutamate methylesterase [Oscillospiraceae bacterium]|nr:chemotaxis response regulator protein-glutamate methylesterase [Oscillospiraceae bacterium]
MPKIRVMIIDDSIMFRTFLTQTFTKDPLLDVVGCYSDPIEAEKHLAADRPDVMVVDMEMPKMRGDEFLRKILPTNKNLKAIVVSSLSGNVFNAMQAGAIDFIGKPGSHPGYDKDQFVPDIIQKVKVAAAAHVIRPGAPQPGASALARTAPPPRRSVLGATTKSLIAIGASTGGTEAIIEVIKNFPANTPGVIIVQHMPPVFTRMYAERVDKLIPMKVREAQNGDRVERGTMLIAPGGDQQFYLRQDASGYYVSLSAGQKVSGHCPSVDVMFESVAKTAGKNAVGVILTGMGADGAKGLTELRKTGAHTIGQDEESCVVYGMPMVAYNMGGVSEQLPLSSIGDAVLKRFS